MSASLAGIIAVGVDSSIWFFGGVGLCLVSFGLGFLKANLWNKAVRPFQYLLLFFWALSAIRWTFSDELALAFWIYATGIFMAWRFRRFEPAANLIA